MGRKKKVGGQEMSNENAAEQALGENGTKKGVTPELAIQACSTNRRALSNDTKNKVK